MLWVFLIAALYERFTLQVLLVQNAYYFFRQSKAG